MSKNAAAEKTAKPTRAVKGSRATGRVTIVDFAAEARLSQMTV